MSSSWSNEARMNVRESTRDQRVLIVQAGGRLDATAVPEFETALRGVLERDAAAVIVDLSTASYISSSGLKAIVSTWRTLRERGGNLVLAGLNPRLHEIFEMVGFTQILRIYADVPAAEEGLRASQA